ncbi:MAG TPA: TIGR00645 family protein [Microbacteriaceae bacterium]|nr:TIGR00645 family protein [Microbacteriaceae bacterium]
MTDLLPPGAQVRRGPSRPMPRALAAIIFASRWLQAPLYIGLIVAQLVYVVVFWIDLVHLVEEVWLGITVGGDEHALDEATIMLGVLGLIDVVMIANLLIMVIIGGYEIFVSKTGIQEHPDQPDWLNHVNANLLKVKLAISIISISSIHLLATFIKVGALPQEGVLPGEATEGDEYTFTGVVMQVVIHLAFIVSALALAWIDKMSTVHRTAVVAAHTESQRS